MSLDDWNSKLQGNRWFKSECVSGFEHKALFSCLDRFERLNEHLNPRMTSTLLCRADRSSVSTVIAIMAIKGHVSEGGKTGSLREEEKDFSDYLKYDIFSVLCIEMPSGRTYLGTEGFQSFRLTWKWTKGHFFSLRGHKRFTPYQLNNTLSITHLLGGGRTWILWVYESYESIYQSLVLIIISMFFPGLFKINFLKVYVQQAHIGAMFQGSRFFIICHIHNHTGYNQ